MKVASTCASVLTCLPASDPCNALVTTRRACYGSCVSSPAAGLRLNFYGLCGWLSPGHNSLCTSLRRSCVGFGSRDAENRASDARSLQSKCTSLAFSASHVRRWHRAGTSEARLQRISSHLKKYPCGCIPAVPATHRRRTCPCTGVRCRCVSAGHAGHAATRSSY